MKWDQMRDERENERMSSVGPRSNKILRSQPGTLINLSLPGISPVKSHNQNVATSETA